MNSLFQSSKIRWSVLTLLSVAVLSISLFGALSVSAQSTVEDDFNNFDEVYEEKAKQCAKSALIQLIIQAVLSMAGTQVPTVDWSNAIKENIEDCLIWAFKAALIETLSMGTVKYVQTGFDGNPAFVQNIGDYLREIANGVAGSYIEDTVPFLCSPFQLQIKLALTNVYRQSQGLGYNPSCTLSDAVENVEGYLSGDFASGGWDGWYEFTSNPYNNPLGALMETSQQLSLRVSSQQGSAQVKLNLGSGFFGKEEQTCYAFQSLDDETGTPFKLLSPKETVNEALARLGIEAPGGTECDEPKIITPGETIKSNLEQAFATNLDNIVSADELNEIIDLAIGYLTYHVLVGEGGLAGYNSEDFEYTGDNQPGVDPNAGQCDMEITDGEPGRGGLLVNEPAPFTSTASDPFKEITIDVPAGQNYSRVVAEFDLTTAPQTAPANASQLNLFWLHRGPNMEQSEWAANDIAEVVLNAENGRVRFATSVNSCEMVERAERSPFRDNITYHVVVDYNPGAGTMSVSADGSTIVSLRTTVNVLQSGDQRDRGGFFIKLGNAENASADEGLADGFTWSNLRVNFTPGEATTGGGDEDGGGDEEGDYRVFLDNVSDGTEALYAENTSTGAVHRLSRTFPYRSSVVGFTTSHDGRRVAYTVKNYDGDQNAITLYSVPVSGGTSAQISNTPDDFDVTHYRFSPDDQYLVYQSVMTTNSLGFIYSARSATGQGNRKITHPDEDRGFRTDWVISCDSRTVYYRNRSTNPDLQKAYSVPIGGGTSTQLPTYNLPVIDCEGGGEDGVARIFIDDLGTPNKNELYSESTSGIVTKISQALGPEGDVFTFERTPDGERVVYSADVQNDRAELFTVPSAGGTITKISTAPTVFEDGTSSDVIRFVISPNGQRVAYAADPNEWTKYELYSVALTGGTVTRISHQLPFDYDVDDFKFSPSSQRVIYRAGRTGIGLWELYSTPSSSAGAIRISQDMDAGQNVPQNGFEVSCNSQTTYFLADLVGGASPVLYSTPTTGGTITEVGGGQLPGNICS